MKHLVRVIALAVFVSTCAGSGPVTDRRVTYKLDSYYEGLCGETTGLSQCAKQIEIRAMEVYPDQAIRNGDELIVNAEVFEDTPGVQYAYAGSAFGTDVVHTNTNVWLVLGLYWHFKSGPPSIPL